MVVDRLLVLYFDSYCMRTREIIIEILRNTRNIQIDRYTHQLCEDITCENKEIRRVGVKFLKRLKCVVNDENVLLCARKVDRKAYLSILKNNINIANQVYRDGVVKGALPNFTVKEHVKIAKINFYVQSLLIRKIRQEGDSELVRQLKERIPVLSDEVDNAIKRMRKSR
ncbi:hypothetical protein THOM_2870 [Trachipleistophora hominis]|uniref:Uncharacterized protein n=1 Tax=Trachipleistophora hominis TaxID=72359 RepID=L7JS34_TRAHO|nr:hypothetical protein THOM_2870 [Trachipleistophora hominis]